MIYVMLLTLFYAAGCQLFHKLFPALFVVGQYVRQIV